jgi:Flp pilus assembly protein TadD
LKGSIVEAGGQIRISANLDDNSGRTIGRAVAQGSENDLFGLVDDLVRELLAARSTGPAARLARVAAASTESVSALKSYLQGEEAFRQGRTMEAMGAFQKAATTDPTFALAHYRLAGAFAGSALIGPARNASQEALRHRARLSEHDRVLVAAQEFAHGFTDDAERY